MTQSAITTIALVIALATSVGSVVLSTGLKLSACPLCYYQRTFAFATTVVLLIGLVYGLQEKITVPALALPLALAGLSVAAWHVSLEARGKMECPVGITGFLSAPKESLTAFVLLSLTLIYGTLLSEFSASGWGPVAIAIALQGAIVPACIFTVAMPAPPKPETYQSPPITCRPLPAPVG